MDNLFETGYERLTSDLMVKIMVRVSAFDLHTWRMVSKNWYRSVRHHDFISKHHKESCQHGFKLVLHCDRKGATNNPHIIHLLNPINGIMKQLRLPIQVSSVDNLILVGANFGCILFRHCIPNGRDLNILYNPSNGHVKAVIDEVDEPLKFMNEVFGLAFIESQNELVIVKCFQRHAEHGFKYFDRYFVGKDRWYHSTVSTMNSSFLVDDSLSIEHYVAWMGFNFTPNFTLLWWVVVLNAETMEIDEYSLPAAAFNSDMSLIKYDNRFSVICSGWVLESGDHYQLWVLNHRSVDGPIWSIIYSIGPL